MGNNDNSSHDVTSKDWIALAGLIFGICSLGFSILIFVLTLYNINAIQDVSVMMVSIRGILNPILSLLVSIWFMIFGFICIKVTFAIW